MEPLGVVAGRHHECGCGVGSDAEEIQQLGRGDHEERLNPGAELGQLCVEPFNAMGQRGQRRLGGRGHRIGRSRRAELGPFGDEGRHREALESTTALLGQAVAEVAHLDQRLDPGLAGRALRHDENPDGLDGAVSGLRLAARPTTEGGSGCFDGVEGIGLATAPALRRFGRSTSMTSTPTRRVAGQAGSIGTGSFDADLGREVEELPHAGDNGAALWRTGDDDGPTSTKLQESLIS